MSKWWLSPVWAIGLCLALLASCKSAKLSDAMKKHQMGEYYEAAIIYRKVYNRTPAKKKALRGAISYNLGECYRLTNNTVRALSSYRNAIRYHYPDSTAQLHLAQMLHKLGQYDEAIEAYQLTIDSFPALRTATIGLQGATIAKKWSQLPGEYAIEPMKLFNSRGAEFSPMYNGTADDQLYITSSRKEAISTEKSAITGIRNNDLFLVEKDEQGKWTTPQVIESEINSEMDEGACTFSADGSTIYYTYCNRSKESDKNAEIYTATRSGAKWGAGTKVAITKDTISMHAHPAMSADGRYLYFVSDMIGGYGGKDIWRARMEGTTINYIENLGGRINTAGDEMFPYSADDGNLYYSSNTLPGLGGLDIFIATEDSLTQRWTLRNAGVPFNSFADDFGVTFATTTDSGFLSSNRNDPRGADHIYSFDRASYGAHVEGFVCNIDDEPIANATVRCVGRDGTILKVFSKDDGSYEITLNRNTQYVMMASAHGYLNSMRRLDTSAEAEEQEYMADFFLSPTTEPVPINNIFYDFDRATLRPESEIALDELVVMLNDNPNVTIEISAHTDRKGSDEYNTKLATARAESVIQYLIAKGIEDLRLTPKGYGKTLPKTITTKLAEQYPQFKEGDLLTPEYIALLTPENQEIADQLNRRTEFKVLSIDFRVF